MEAKVSLLRNDEFALLVALHELADLIRGQLLQSTGPVEIRIEDARYPHWDDLTSRYPSGPERGLHAWQIKRQTTILDDSVLAGMFDALHRHGDIDVAHFVTLDLVDVKGVGPLRALRSLTERAGVRGVDPTILEHGLTTAEARWLGFVRKSVPSLPAGDAFRLLGRLRIESIGVPDDLRARVIERLGTIYEDPRRALGALRNFLTANLDASAAITWSTLAGLDGAGPRRVAAARLIRSGVEPIPEDPLPSDLMRAAHRLLRFQGRATEMERLDAWWNAKERISVLLYTASGGSGKSRLLIEWCAALEGRGEIAGFVPPLMDLADARRLLDLSRKVTLVIDYAENRAPEIRAILEAASTENAPGAALRLVLLARNDGEWWAQIGALDYSVNRLTQRRRIHALPPLLMDPGARRRLFEEATSAFTPFIAPEGESLPAPDLGGEHFGSPLFIQLAALAAMRGLPITQAGDLLNAVVDHEQRYWARAIRGLGASPFDVSLLEEAFPTVVCLLTLWGGASAATVRALCTGIGRIPAGRPDLVESIVTLLRRFYPAEPVDRFRGLEPDLIGEHFLMAVLRRRPDVLAASLDDRPDGESAAVLRCLSRLAEWSEEALSFLERALVERLETHGRIAVEVAREGHEPLGAALAMAADAATSSAALYTLLLAVPSTSSALRRVRLVTANKLLLGSLPEDSNIPQEKLAYWHFQLGIVAAREWYALKKTTHSLDIIDYLERLLAKFPSLFSDRDKIDQLLIKGALLKFHGRAAEGIDLTAEAVAIARHAAATNPEARELLARCLNDLSIQLWNSGRNREAESIVLESVALRRELARVAQNKTKGLVASLASLATIQTELGQFEEALKVSEEVVRLARDLSDRDPDAMEADFAIHLTNHAKSLDRVGSFEEALTCIREAVGLRKRLAQDQLEMHMDGWIKAVLTMKHIANAARRSDQVEAAYGSLIEFTRDGLDQLALNGTHVTTLIEAIHRWLHDLESAGKQQEALQKRRDLMQLLQQAVDAGFIALQAPLMVSLNDLSWKLCLAGHFDESISTGERGVALASLLPESEGRDRLLKTLHGNITDARLQRGDDSAAIEKAAFECEVVCRRLCALGIADFALDLIKIVGCRFDQLRKLGRYDDCIDSVRSAVQIYYAVGLKYDDWIMNLQAELQSLGFEANEASRPDEAIRAFVLSADIGATNEQPDSMIIDANNRCLAAVLLLHAGRPEEALLQMNQGLAMLASVPPRYWPAELMTNIPNYIRDQRATAKACGAKVDNKIISRLRAVLASKRR